MRYSPLGQTGFKISAVGFGTCQIRLVPEQQAIDTLKRGFELGVNWVHTAPDYEGADDLVAQAIEESGHSVMPFSQGYGDRNHFEYLFEEACRKFKKSKLEAFGIACLEDREYLKQPVWEPGGIVDFLREKKQEGRLGSIFCTSHGTPDYLIQLIQSGVFDALMIAYNPLGFHLLSYHPGHHRPFENIPETYRQVFPIAQQHQVSLLIMKPLAGGLLVPGQAFPPRHRFSTESTTLKASEVLRFILNQPGVCSVVPGTASVEEAEENALAGYDWLPLKSVASDIEASIKAMQMSLCSRCGYCDKLCSQDLPISWLFRDAYIQHYPSEIFESPDAYHYFRLTPRESVACQTCQQQTCECPYGIDIPSSLLDIHRRMLSLEKQGVLPYSNSSPELRSSSELLVVRVLRQQVPTQMDSHDSVVCQFQLQNLGNCPWFPSLSLDDHSLETYLVVTIFGHTKQRIPIRHIVPPHTSTHITFALSLNLSPGLYPVRFTLISSPRDTSSLDYDQIVLCSTALEIIS